MFFRSARPTPCSRSAGVVSVERKNESDALPEPGQSNPVALKDGGCKENGGGMPSRYRNSGKPFHAGARKMLCPRVNSDDVEVLFRRTRSAIAFQYVIVFLVVVALSSFVPDFDTPAGKALFWMFLGMILISGVRRIAALVRTPGKEDLLIFKADRNGLYLVPHDIHEGGTCFRKSGIVRLQWEEIERILAADVLVLAHGVCYDNDGRNMMAIFVSPAVAGFYRNSLSFTPDRKQFVAYVPYPDRCVLQMLEAIEKFSDGKLRAEMFKKVVFDFKSRSILVSEERSAHVVGEV